ncbi:hypothetical protein EON64_19680 [archaeon]|nr:MAG: hypothetical protein EON64_19680 [archaeon]
MNFWRLSSDLSDWGLRRVYKFVLKSAIGRYLEDDLDIEQVQVDSAQGRIVLHDLRLNAPLLTQLLLSANNSNSNNINSSSLSLEVEAILIDRAVLHLSLSSLFSESCHLEVDTVTVRVRLVHPTSARGTSSKTGTSRVD